MVADVNYQTAMGRSVTHLHVTCCRLREDSQRSISPYASVSVQRGKAMVTLLPVGRKAPPENIGDRYSLKS